MGLFTKSAWIFILAILSLIIAAAFPSPAMIAFVAFFTALLVMAQTFSVLFDEKEAVPVESEPTQPS
jgi:hypothetical protein